MARVVYGLFLILSIYGCQEREKTASEKAAYELLDRVLPNHVASFEFKEIQSDKNKDIFEISNGEGEKIMISGNSAVAMASGLIGI